MIPFLKVQIALKLISALTVDLCSYEHSNVTFQQSSTVIFYHNKAEVSGGAIHVEHVCIVGFEGNSTVEFYNNTAEINGETMSVNHGHSTV